MQKVHTSSLLARPDTMFGVCQGLGEDFGFNPNWLRVAFALIVVFNVGLALGAYAAAGVLVLVSRLLYPGRRKDAASAVSEPVVQAGEDAPAAETARRNASSSPPDRSGRLRSPDWARAGRFS